MQRRCSAVFQAYPGMAGSFLLDDACRVSNSDKRCDLVMEFVITRFSLVTFRFEKTCLGCASVGRLSCVIECLANKSSTFLA